MTSTSGDEIHPRSSLGRTEILVLLALGLVVFLIKLPYLPAWLIASVTFLLMAVGWGYVRARYGFSLSPVILVLLAGAVAVDGLGNAFHLYGRTFGPLMYDAFAHLVASALTVPAIIWMLDELLRRRGQRLSLGWITVFGITGSFSVDAFYEVLELWDELYFGGQRIWGPYDAPRDLQWDLIGIFIGASVTYAVNRHRRSSDPAHRPDG
ncbi:MAG: hypothetical protein D6723_17630 [Acidobacteria bacterium]|nr:MAG: hypothetical protein D6723_17630 [Acidobacteriota bacterium]